MASSFNLTMGDRATPEYKGGWRIGVGGNAKVKRDSFGPFIMQIWRGDGAEPENYTYLVREKIWGPYASGALAEIDLASLDLNLPDATPRNYQLTVIADGGATISVETAYIASEPHAPAGRLPA